MLPWRKIAIWSLAVITLTVVGIFLFHVEENWRAGYAWKRYKHQLAMQGEALDWNAYISAPVADDDNIFKAPQMTEWFVRSIERNTTNSLYEHLRFTTGASLPTPIAELTAAKAERFITQCQKVDADFAVLETAVQRPSARIDGDYHNALDAGQLTPNFISIRVVAQALAHRARCFLVLHQPDRALRDLTLVHNLSRLLKGKPGFLVTAMIDVAVTSLYLDSINQGLQLHLWNDDALGALQTQLAEINFVPALPAAVREERVGVLFLFEGLSESGWVKEFGELGLDPGPTTKSKAAAQTFSNARYQNLRVFSEIEQGFIDAFPTNHIVDPSRVDAAQASADKKTKRPASDNLLARMAIPNFGKATKTTVRNQVKVDTALIACALERYQLAHGQYPDNLNALTPEFLDHVPVDIIGGKPLRYDRSADGSFTLYSVGWNVNDDGGQSSNAPDSAQGDWVWPMAQQR